MELEQLTAICPIDGRYGSKTAELREFFSEYGLIRYRILVEVRWLQQLAMTTDISEIPDFSKDATEYLNAIVVNFSSSDAQKVKSFEAETNHDVKAVEYFIKEQLDKHPELASFKEFVHFACTSEDINNLAYGQMLYQAQHEIMFPMMSNILENLTNLATEFSDIPMLSRTHGQAATPSTVGKEFANFVARLQRQFNHLQELPIKGKLNGAVGNYNAHMAAYPDIDWHLLSQQFVEKLNLSWNPYTTQIENHDYLAEIFHSYCRFNSILIDLSRDIWGYISMAYFKQKLVANEVGSSTMPHKVNPIDFENAEGNLSLANAIMNFLAQQLLTSRWQRDLVDSTLMRNVGLGLSYSLIAYKSLLKGLNKLEINQQAIDNDLANRWELLAEPIQTVMRRYGVTGAYEQLKALTRGQAITQEILKKFIDGLVIPEDSKRHLKSLTPSNYVGLAKQLALNVKD